MSLSVRTGAERRKWVLRRVFFSHRAFRDWRKVWSGLTGTLGILIAFRTQQALDRFWEG